MKLPLWFPFLLPVDGEAQAAAEESDSTPEEIDLIIPRSERFPPVRPTGDLPHHETYPAEPDWTFNPHLYI